MKNKVVYVEAKPLPIGKEREIKGATGQERKNLLGHEKYVTSKETQWERTGWSDSEVDGEQLFDDIAQQVKDLNSQGYEVVSVLPITSGRYDHEFRGIGGGQVPLNGGYGFSYTSGVTIIAKKIDH